MTARGWNRAFPVALRGCSATEEFYHRHRIWSKGASRCYTNILSGKRYFSDTPKTDENVKDVLQKMRSRLHEANAEGNSIHGGWDVVWKEGLTPWDLGKPTPALVKELEQIRNSEEFERSRLTTLVPGCGSGYDLVTLADHQDRLISKSNSVEESLVVGLEVSATSLEISNRLIRSNFAVDEGNSALRTRIELVHGDFFSNSSNWKVHSTVGAADGSNGKLPEGLLFDLIFDYTFFCALSPSLRAAWGERMAELLHPETGKLLTLIFPIPPEDQAVEMKGPPYPVTVQDYRDVLEPHGLVMTLEPYASPHTVPSRSGKELVCWWEVEKE